MTQTHIRIIFQSICLLALAGAVSAQADTATYTTPGTVTWTCPAGVNSVQVQCWGGGGAGGGAHKTSGNCAGGGGGGGAYASSTVSVTPGTGYTVVVGGGGTATVASTIVAVGTAASGVNSSFGGTTVVAAGGGGGADAYNAYNTAFGSGGTTANSTGTTSWSGGNGQGGNSGHYAGGGGSGAGTAANGGNATGNYLGGTPPAGGGAGGNGVSGATTGIGSPGQSPGGAGGAAGEYSSNASVNGGNGATGQVVLTYTIVYDHVNVETAADGSGSIVGTQNVNSGSSITVYAIARAADNSFIVNCPATWSLVNISPNVVSGDLVPSGDTKSAVFTGHLSGSANIEATNANATGSPSFNTSGLITVPATGTVSTWTDGNHATDDNWSDALNWSGGLPHSAGDTATFGSTVSPVVLDASESVANLIFNQASSYTISGANTLTLDNSTRGATISVTAGTANQISTAVALNDNATVTVSSGKALAVSGSIANAPIVTKTLTVSGAGTTVLSSANTYGPASSGTVGTTLSGGGTLQIGNNTSLGAGDVSVSGNSTIQAGAAVSVGNNIAIADATTVDNNGNNLTLGGVISGGGALTKIGSGTLTLSGANTYAGSTTNANGVLSIASDSNLGTAPGSATANSLVLGSSTSDLLLTGSATLNATRGVGIGASSGSAGSTALIDVASGQAATINGIIASAGNTGANGLTINSGSGNTGTLTLGGANTFGGTTLISAGTLQLGNSAALQNSTLNYISGALSIGSPAAITLGGLSGSQNISLVNGSSAAVALTVGGNNASTSYSGNLSGTGGSLTKLGTGALTLSGASSFTGAVTDGGGTLTISGGTFGSATSDIEVGNGVASVVFSITGGTVTARNFNIADLANSTGSRASITGTASATFNAVNLASVANTGSNLTVNTTGTVALGAATFNRDGGANSAVANTGGGLIINNGTVTATSFIAASTTAQRPSDLNLNGGSLTISAATGGFELATGAGNGFLTQTAGTLSYLGSDGLLMNTVGANVSAATISGGTATLTGITLNQVNAASGVTSSLTLSGGATLYLGSVGLVINQPSGTVFATLGTSTVGAIADWSSSAPITLTGTPVTFQAANSSAVAHNITLSGILSGAGALTKTGSGTLTLSGPNTYGGATTVSSGTLALSGSGSLASSLISVASGATLDVTGLSSTFALVSSQTLSNRASATGIINGSVTTSSGSTISLSFVAGTPALTMAGGTLTPDPATTFNVNNTGSPLTSHTYKLISKTGGTVAASGALPAVTVGGAGVAPGTSALLSIVGGELYLVVNHLPVANSFTLAASIGTPVTVSVVPKFATDPDGDALTLTIASAPTNTTGSAVVDGTGSNITYTVSSATSGPGDSFTYTATDAYGAATTGTVTVTINQTGQSYNSLTPPVLNNGKVTMSFLGIPTYKYALDWTHSLTPPVTWLPVVTNPAAANGILLYTNTPSGGNDFYRTRYTP